jgi:tRNA-dihydrouridine synthase
MVKEILDLGYPWLDINLGCPSNTVTKNGGGSSLLLDLDLLRTIIRNIRSNFNGRLTAKVRTGFHHTNDFETIIKILNDEGVELITVHGRTRDMMYKVPAVWSFIEKAVKLSQVPIIGNGDVWCTSDVDRMMNETGCHGVMVARGALKSPWMAQDYRIGHFNETSIERAKRIKAFFKEYRHQLELENISDRGLLKQTKSVSRFMFEGLDSGDVHRRKLLLAQTIPEIYAVIESL